MFCLFGYVTNNKISRCTTTGVMPNTQISSILLLVKVAAQLTKAKKYMSVSPNSKKTERVSKYANFILLQYNKLGFQEFHSEY